jgi:intracellular sulfur oxidation DsrE/DsrF family protein
MNRLFVMVCCVFFACGLLEAQEHPYRVVFDLTSRDSLEQKAVMRWIREITTASPKAELEVVMYGKGLELVMPGKSTMLTEVNAAMKNPNVSFRVCEGAMRNNNVSRDQMLPGITTVPDGIYEIITKQHEGWGYIKVMH